MLIFRVVLFAAVWLVCTPVILISALSRTSSYFETEDGMENHDFGAGYFDQLRRSAPWEDFSDQPGGKMNLGF